jgi:hypothetical protein
MIRYTMTFEDLGNGYWKGVLTDERNNIVSMVEGETSQPDDGFFAHLTECAFMGKMLRDCPPTKRQIRDGNWD